MSSTADAGRLDALQQGADQLGRQVVGAGVAEDAFFGMGTADGSADGLDDDGVAHEWEPFTLAAGFGGVTGPCDPVSGSLPSIRAARGRRGPSSTSCSVGS